MADNMSSTPETSIDEPWTRDAGGIARDLSSDISAGLSTADATSRLETYGQNTLDASDPIPFLTKLAAQFRDPLVGLLLVATAISLVAWFLDDESSVPIDAIVIVVIVIANAALGLWQEAKAEDAIAALQSLTETHSTVRRDGEVMSVASSELVPGDILLLGEGDAVGADARLVEVASLAVAEAPLTGESLPSEKQIDVLEAASLGDRTNMVFNGTAVSTGRGTAIVTATGMSTEMGRIATLLDRQEQPATPLQQEIAWVSKTLGIGVTILTAVVVGAIVLTSELSSLADYVDALLVGVSLAVAAVPEGLPAILSVVLALGVQRMSEERAVVKKLLSVETLGSASVICSDKTGTLTRNEMTIATVVTGSGVVELTGAGYAPVGEVVHDGLAVTDGLLLDEVIAVIGAGSLANDATIRLGDDGITHILGDPTEAAFLVAEEKLGGSATRREQFERVDEIPFTSERKMMSTLNADKSPSENDLVVVTKGAPDVLLDRCSSERRAGEVEILTPTRRAEIAKSIDGLSDQAMRTLAVAYRTIDRVDQASAEFVEEGLTLLGIVGIVDPPRPEAREAITEAHRAGVRVVLITGDHPLTARRIAEKLTIVVEGEEPLTGEDLENLDSAGLADALTHTSVFARVAPDHKLRIVEQLQASGEVVAMTGDGVNDAPALRRADIGVAMGVTGTEVSKEAADLILADDNFATIVVGVREGRAIFSNIAKFLRYLLSSNAGEVLVMFVGILGAGVIGLTDIDDGLAVPLLATQILWINLLTDTGLALALGVDPPVDDPMSRRPRRLTDRIIDRTMLFTIGLTGVVLALGGLVALDLELAGGLFGGDGNIVDARTQVFTVLVLGNMFAAFNSRSQISSAFVQLLANRWLWVAAAITLALQIAVVYLPPLQNAFDTAPMSIGDWIRCVALASGVLWAEELRKLIVRRSVQ